VNRNIGVAKEERFLDFLDEQALAANVR